jgi:hypothetical protein
MSNMQGHKGRIAAALVVAGLAAGAFQLSWHEAGAGELAVLRDVDGSDLKQLVLSSVAAKRLGIETGTVREEEVRRWLMAMSEMEAIEGNNEYALAVPDIDTASTSPADESVIPLRVKVPVRNSETSAGKVIEGVSVADSQTNGDEIGNTDAVIFPTGSPYGKVWYNAKAMSPGPKDGDERYFAVEDSESGLRAGQPVIVRITEPGRGLQKVVPYSAVVYDLQGYSWVYVNPEPLVFVRYPVSVEQVEKDLAILTEGPGSGTRIVTVGSAGLLGIERQLAP